MKVIIVGAGWAGCAAAVAAAKNGADVTLCERTDMPLGTGLVGGIMRNNGRFTAAEEAIALGGGDLFAITDANCRHKNVDFPGHKHASLYDIAKTPMAVQRHLEKLSIRLLFEHRITKVRMTKDAIAAVQADNGSWLAGDVFVDTTGTAGPMNNCAQYGNGCAMCVLRCPSYGGRVSLAALAGVAELQSKRPDGQPGP